MKDPNLEKLVSFEWLLYSLVIYRFNETVEVHTFLNGYPVNEVFVNKIYDAHPIFKTKLSDLSSKCAEDTSYEKLDEINILAEELIEDLKELTTPNK